MADKRESRIIAIPDDKEYAADMNNEFPDEYYVGPFSPDPVDNQLLPGTSQWYNTALDAVFRWDGKNWNPDPTAEKWVLNQLTCEPLGRVIGPKRKKGSLPQMDIEALRSVEL